MSETISSPVFGYSVTFLREGGDYDLVRISVKPGGGNFRHFHLGFTELFTIEEGVLSVELRGELSDLKVGQQLLVPKRMPHRFFNGTPSHVVLTARMEPASRFPDVLRIAYGLARDGKTNGKGIPKNILHIAYFWSCDKTAAALAPPWLIALAMQPLIWIGRVLGVGRRLEKRYVPGRS